MKEIKVASEREYAVTFPSSWQERFESITSSRNFVVLAPESLSTSIAKVVDSKHLIMTKDGESQKTLSSYGEILKKFGELGLDRRSVVIGIGGGATTDLAGFVAATFLRGVDWVAIPTTVAGMVDAAIGGKTGINLPAGKNLVGSFHSPAEVVVDLRWLETLSERDARAGLAEAVKCGFIAKPRILELIPHWKNSLREIIELSIEVKALVVSRDFKESYEREILNYGHTLGHAIERHADYSLRHGEAISIGMCFAAELSRRLLGLNDDVVQLHNELLECLALPTSYSADAFDSLYGFMQSDKKRGAEGIRFVTLDSIGSTKRSVATRDLLRDTYLSSVGR